MDAYIYPPRPKFSVPTSDLDYYDNTDKWLCQYKYNGSRNLIHILGNDVRLYGRHGGPHLAFSLSVPLKKEILELPGLEKGKEYWFDSELLIKTKSKETRGKIVLFDILQDGRYLFLRPNQVERLEILDKICGHPSTLDPWRQMALQISESLLMAPSWLSRFQFHFNEKACDEVEGVVLRKRNSSLDNYGQKPYEASWMIRCRKHHKNYDF